MQGVLPDRFKVRPAREADLDAVADLMEAADRELGAPPDIARDELRWLWRLPSTDFDRDTRIVEDSRSVVGYGEGTWMHPEEGGQLNLQVRTHPDARGNGIATYLLEWGESLARERGSEGLRIGVAERDAPAKALLSSRGYVEVRSFFTMTKEIQPGEDPGISPEGVMIRRYEDRDERALYEVCEAAFSDHWGNHPTSFENFNEELHGEDWDPSLVFLAEAEGEAVGAVVGFLFEQCGFVGILGVIKEWRNRGIGKALLQRSFADFASRGQREVRLGVDTENTYDAVALYEKAGMTVYRKFDMFDLGTPEAAAASR